MVRALLLAGLCGSLIGAGQDADPFGGLPDPRSAALLAELCSDRAQPDMAAHDGRYIHDLVLRNDLKAGVALGPSCGCAAFWLAAAFGRTGGRLIAVEQNTTAGRRVRADLERAGLAACVDLKVGEAAAIASALTGPFDLVFLGTQPRACAALLKTILPKVRPGGFVIAYNVREQRSAMAEFFALVTGDPRLRTELVASAGPGLSVTRKVR